MFNLALNCELWLENSRLEPSGLFCSPHTLSKLELPADSLLMRVPEKRRRDRLLCAGLVEVRWADAEGKACSMVANLDDVSPGGASLLLDCPVPQGTLVEFPLSGQTVNGRVRYCNAVDIGWIVGVEFGPDSHWDPSVCPPDHLLDPKSIPEGAQLREGDRLSSAVRNTISCLVLGDAVQREQE